MDARRISRRDRERISIIQVILTVPAARAPHVPGARRIISTIKLTNATAVRPRNYCVRPMTISVRLIATATSLRNAFAPPKCTAVTHAAQPTAAITVWPTAIPVVQIRNTPSINAMLRRLTMHSAVQTIIVVRPHINFAEPLSDVALSAPFTHYPLMKLIGFLKEWALIFAILLGVLGYFVYISLPVPAALHGIVTEGIGIIQPVLIFTMLYLSFCRVNPRDLRLRSWHLWILLLQTGFFIGIGCLLIAMPHSPMRIVLEGAMLCMICPTATAGAVVTRKLGGNVSDITSYTILINLVAALLIPALMPFVHPNPDLNVWQAAWRILVKVFPLLLLPLACAMASRRWLPRMVSYFDRYPDLSFYIWAFSLSLAIAVTTRSIWHSTVAVSTQLWLIGISFICCMAQFALGRWVGHRYGDHITAGQSMGQKNTVFAIWLGYTFFTPVTALVGGFYSIWHNVFNSWQLHKHHQQLESHQNDSPAIGENGKNC